MTDRPPSTDPKSPGRRPRPAIGPLAWTGIAIVTACTAIAVLAPVLAPHGPGEILSTRSYAAPGEVGLLGTDYLGRDVFSRLLHGARYTMGLALAATAVGFIAGALLGFAAAELRGFADVAIGRLVDVMVSFPPILLALVVITGLGSSLTVLVATVGLIHASRVARVARAIAMNVAVMDFVDVARARGEGLAYILRREIWPNTVRPLATEFGLRLTFSVLFISSLSFLGLGIQPPAADWGGMVRENMSGLFYGAWAALLPAAAIAIVTVGIAFVVDWLGAQSGREISQELVR